MTNPRGKKAAEDSYLPRSVMAFISKLYLCKENPLMQVF